MYTVYVIERTTVLLIFTISVISILKKLAINNKIKNKLR